MVNLRLFFWHFFIFTDIISAKSQVSDRVELRVEKGIMYNITFQQIEAFLIAAQTLNLTKAAESLLITQSALSRTLQRFEEGIHLQLFTRSNQGLALTTEGKYLYSTMVKLHENMNKTIQTAQNISTAQAKTLRIVAPSSFDAAADFDRIKGIVRLYQNEFPNVLLIESLCDFKELRQTIEYGDCDLAFTQDFSVIDIPGLSFKRISKFGMYLAMSAHHPLAGLDEPDFTALGSEMFYTVPIPDSADINNIEARCRRLGFTPKGLEYVPNFQTLLRNIRQGKGMAMCGRFNYIGHNDIKYYPLPASENQFYVVVAWRTGRLSDEADHFINMLSDESIADSI
jgi:DNA-binding transcriptional LysR family regulator